MAVKAVDLDLYQGDDWAAMVAVLMTDMTPADLTGYTAQSQIRTGPADQVSNVAAEMVCTVVPPNNISLYLSHAQTTQLTGFGYQWDLQLTSAADEITTIMAGNVNVVQEVTREPALLVRR